MVKNLLIAAAFLLPSQAYASCVYPNVLGQGPNAVRAAQEAYNACVQADFQRQQQLTIQRQQLQIQQQMLLEQQRQNQLLQQQQRQNANPLAWPN